ncbi:MAG TPA: peroxiredoxin [Methylomusa anaerophila]|uniref:thioredoxin-dependent peroxiredoxin n=1 Tax=Methylomusa anaerophila TaxID=1930071 RepID=A0A348ANS8_9FIRM|nr:peroxiredoxin [Methylomusa anaerophila]BBB92726.1 putative peroxiredoxin bcp [Methylomusa anaerophila]HML87421.1 peroxiredoxin [Methylomusa anaerophila]
MDTLTEVAVGQVAPDFSLPATGGGIITLTQYRGKKVVLYFFSKDNTSGCTKEAVDFRDLYQDIVATGAQVLGISRDSIEVHEKFRIKYELPFPLLSDVDTHVGQLYGVFKEKNMYGKKVLGVERSTFIINEEGIVTHVFRKVKVAGHAAAVLSALKTDK